MDFHTLITLVLLAIKHVRNANELTPDTLISDTPHNGDLVNQVEDKVSELIRTVSHYEKLADAWSERQDTDVINAARESTQGT